MVEVTIVCWWRCHCYRCGTYAPFNPAGSNEKLTGLDNGKMPPLVGCGDRGREFHGWMPPRPWVEVQVA